MVMVVDRAWSRFSAGLAFRQRFRGSTAAVLSGRRQPDRALDPGQPRHRPAVPACSACDPAWYSSAFGAHLTWTLPFGLLIMFAVFNRFDRRYEEAARDLGATSWQTFRHVVLPIIAPSLIGVGLFGFTLSYDEFARTPADRRHLQHPAARDLRHDHQRHHAGALCAGHRDHRLVLPGDRAGAGLGHHRAPPPRAPRQRRRQGGMTWLAARACCGWPTAGPQDTAPLAAAIDRGEVDPGDHRRHRRQDRGQRLRQRFHPRLRHPGAEAAAGRAPAAARRPRSRSASPSSCPAAPRAGCRRISWCSAARRRRRAASAPRLAIGVGLTRAFKPEEIGRAAQIEATAEAVPAAHDGCRHRLAGRRAFRPDQVPAAHQGAHRGGGAARRDDRDRGHLSFDGAVARRLGARRRRGAGRDADAPRTEAAICKRLVALSPASPAPRPASSCCATRSSCWAMPRAGRAIS